MQVSKSQAGAVGAAGAEGEGQEGEEGQDGEGEEGAKGETRAEVRCEPQVQEQNTCDPSVVGSVPDAVEGGVHSTEVGFSGGGLQNGERLVGHGAGGPNDSHKVNLDDPTDTGL